MASYRISAAAARDIRDIVDFGYESWGPQRADAYLARMKVAIDEIATRPLMFPEFNHISPGLRRRVWNAHMIFFEIEGGEIVVLRILGRQDVERQIFGD